jgi:hypothetical protein
VPANTGTGSAIMISVNQNVTFSYARTCVVDARWATGQAFQSDPSVIGSWESQADIQPFDLPSSPRNWAFHRVGLSDARYGSNHSRPIAVEQEWLDACAPPMPKTSLVGNELIMTSFEALHPARDKRMGQKDIRMG